MARKPAATVGDIEIRLLRIFHTVVECGGFTAAEAALNIGRAAISMHMADLEKRLGLRLCRRGRAGFALTDEGRQVHDACLPLFAALENFQGEVNTMHARLRGSLDIGIIDNLVTMPRMQVTDALSALKDVGPDVRVNIRMIPPTEVEIGVLDGRLHVGIAPALRNLPGLDYRPLYDEESQLYCAAGHPLFEVAETGIRDEMIAEAEAVAPTYGQSLEVRALHRPLRTTATANDREGVAFLILTGRYIGYLPTHYAALWVDQGRLRALRPGDYHYVTEFRVVTRKGGRPNLILQTYLDLLES
ncbi:LysR family transcriptional regulator [Zavarzinia compransoris]|uniref:LysR family transcriptional regulator n=1 Tax=Zavarzinia marina TaxID=2911065 RepID=UPI001F17B598|nr:LysR family transcriptional regulator [Zavarzinia marina]MCF4167191.1 LysR family transcriptional regulator [Zavarzinia marina]